MLNANYQKADLEQEVSKIIHLIKLQWVILLECVKCYKDIFYGNIGEWTGSPIDIPIKLKSKHYHTWAFPIQVIHIKAFKKYLNRLVTIGVPKKFNLSEWPTPSFIILNKDGRVRFIYDFRRLNKEIKNMQYPITYIKDMLDKISNVTYVTALNLIMVYYNI